MSRLNFGDLFDAVARAIPQQPAIVHGDVVLSWRELDERSNRLARQLQALGLQPGSKVAFYLRNSPAYIELHAACFKARLVHVNVNYRYVDSELRYIFENSDAEAIVYDPEFRGHISALRAQLPNVRAYIETGTDVVAADVLSFEALCATGGASPLTVARSADDLYFMYTGGTTGVPKAVMWPHGNRIEVIGMADAENADAHAAAVAAAPSRPIVLPACPMMHSTGFTSSLSALVNGGCVVLLPSPRFDAAECLQVIDRWR